MATIAGSLSTPLPPHADTLARSILDRVAATPDKLAFLSPGPDDSWNVKYTWREAGDEMMKLGAGLLELGIELEERVAIASSTRTEWIFADAAVMLAGGANTTIYPSTSEDDFAYILSDSGTRFLIAPPQGTSWPSSHPAVLTTFTTVAGRELGVSAFARVGLSALGLTVAASRVYVGVHYPSDVASGFLLGKAVAAMWPRGDRAREARGARSHRR